MPTLQEVTLVGRSVFSGSESGGATCTSSCSIDDDGNRTVTTNYTSYSERQTTPWRHGEALVNGVRLHYVRADPPPPPAVVSPSVQYVVDSRRRNGDNSRQSQRPTVVEGVPRSTATTAPDFTSGTTSPTPSCLSWGSTESGARSCRPLSPTTSTSSSSMSGAAPSHPIMVLLHGFPDFWYSWRHQLTAFRQNQHVHCDNTNGTDQNYSVVAVDMRGYNYSEKVGSGYTLNTLSEDIYQFILHLLEQRELSLPSQQRRRPNEDLMMDNSGERTRKRRLSSSSSSSSSYRATNTAPDGTTGARKGGAAHASISQRRENVISAALHPDDDEKEEKVDRYQDNCNASSKSRHRHRKRRSNRTKYRGSVVLVGHDWGGVVAQAVAVRFPDVVDKLVVLNAPTLQQFRVLPSLWTWKQRLVFTLLSSSPCGTVTDELLGWNRSWLLTKLFWSADDEDEGEDCKGDGDVENRQRRRSDSATGMRLYRDAMSQPGATSCMLSHLRSLSESITESKEYDLSNLTTSPILHLWGGRNAQAGFCSSDASTSNLFSCPPPTLDQLPPTAKKSMATDLEDDVGSGNQQHSQNESYENVQFVQVLDRGRSTHQGRPEEVNRIISRFLAERVM